MIDAYKAQIAEAAKLKGELDLIHDAINQTKQEIATVHVTGFEGPEMARVTNELDAIVGGTETRDRDDPQRAPRRSTRWPRRCSRA